VLPHNFHGASRVLTGAATPTYSICTLVTEPEQYRQCLDEFRAHGFVEPDCEFLYVDNTDGNTFDAYAGLNVFLASASGRYIILCHQDIQLPAHGRDRLDECIAEMDRRDPAWGVLGSSGGLANGNLAIRITDPNVPVLPGHSFPARCISLDEAFILVRAAANLALSRDLSGFHLYGTDLCLLADILGWTSWVIDFQLHHLSRGNTGAAFKQARAEMIGKYRRALRPRIMTTTCTTMPLTSSPLLSLLGRSTKGMTLWRRLLGSSP
jgi:hypothetical protein